MCQSQNCLVQGKKINENFSQIGLQSAMSSILAYKNQKSVDDANAIVQSLLQENEQLMQIVERVKKERETAQSRALINIQIAEQVQLHENEILQEFEEKITELRRIIQDKEYTIQEFEKSKPIIENGVLFKCKEIATPTEQVIKLHNENEEQKNHISQLLQQMQDLQNINQDFALKNFLGFQKRIIQDKASLGQLSEYLATKMFNINQFNNLNLAYALNNEEDISFDENSMFMRDYYDLKKIAEEYKTGEEGENQSEEIENSGNNNKQQFQIPSIDIHKAQQVQQKILDIKFGKQNTVNNEEIKNYMEKISKLEEESKKYKKLWEREAFGNKLLLQNLKVIDSFANKTVETNENLVNSNRLLSERSIKLLSIADYFHTFYLKYIALVSKRQLLQKRRSLNEIIIQVPKKMETINNKLETINNKLVNVNVSILEDDNMLKKGKKKQQQENQLEEKFEEQLTPNFDSTPEQKMLVEEFKQLKEEVIVTDQQFQGQDEQDKNEFDEFDLEECKIYLMNMARDLYCENQVFNDIITKEMLKSVRFNSNIRTKFKNYIQIRRTLSNAIEYVSDTMSKKIEGEINSEKKKKKRFVREFQKEQLQQDKSALVHEEQKQQGFIKKRGFMPFQADDISQILAAGYNPTEDDINKTQRMEDLQLLEFK